MLQTLFTIYDKKARNYNRPFTSANRATAMREAGDGASNDEVLSTHAEDFALYLLGTFDPETGEIDAIHPPEMVCEIVDLVEPDEVADIGRESFIRAMDAADRGH